MTVYAHTLPLFEIVCLEDSAETNYVENGFTAWLILCISINLVLAFATFFPDFLKRLTARILTTRFLGRAMLVLSLLGMGAYASWKVWWMGV